MYNSTLSGWIISRFDRVLVDGFINIDGVARAKGEILQGSKSPNFAILNRDDNYFDLWSNMGKQSEIISFGSNSKAMVYPKNIVLEKNHCTFDLNCPHGSETINLNLPGLMNSEFEFKSWI